MDFSKLRESMSSLQLSFVATISIVYLTIGGLSNIASMTMFNSNLYRKQRVTVFLNASFVMNLVAVLYLPIMLLAPIWLINKSTCMLFPGIFNFIIKIQSWVAAIGSLDRLIGSYKPNSCLFKNDFKFQLISLVAIMFLLASVSFPEVFYIAQSSSYNNKTICAYTIDYKLTWLPTFYIIECLLFRIILPFSIILISNFFLILKLSRKTTRFIQNRQHQNRLLKSLIASDIIFSLCRIPMVSFAFSVSASSFNMHTFTYSAFLAFGLISSAFSFLIMIIFNKDYRQLFQHFLYCSIRGRKNRAVVKRLIKSTLKLNTITQELASYKH